MKRLIGRIAIGLLMGLWVAISGAEGIVTDGKDQAGALDGRVQDVKKQALDIAGGMIQLEEKLLSSPATQLAIFIAAPQGDPFLLDEVKIKIDGAEAANHHYTGNELAALQLGGVQRIYTGNIGAGEHTLVVDVTGKSTGKNAGQQTAEYKFSKDANSKIIEVTLAEPDSGKRISFRE